MWEHLLDIRCSLDSSLEGRVVILGVTGSIAALESFRLARLLIRHGASVRVVMTQAACGLVRPEALEWSTGYPVVTELTGRCEHIELAGERGVGDLLCVAPATANSISQMALGLDDTPVTTVATSALGRGLPVVLAPGMHACMAGHPAVEAHLRALEKMGVRVVAPLVEEGKAKMARPEEVVAEVRRLLGPGDLESKRVVITGGPTREFLDPARCFTNPSSGRTAVELACEAYRRGATVRLVYGPGSVPVPSWIETVRVETAEQMSRALLAELKSSPDYVVGAAAVADFRPAETRAEKIRTAEGGLSVAMTPTPKLIDQVASVAPGCRLVAFKAESGSEERLGSAMTRTLERTRAFAVVGNFIDRPGQGFESSENQFRVLFADGHQIRLEQQSKARLAQELWSTLVGRA